MAGKPESGVVFPNDIDAKGKPSTQETGKKVFAAAIAAVDKEASERILSEKKWRFRYNKYVVEQVEKSAVKPENAVAVAKAGLKYVHSTFQFVRGDKKLSIEEAMKDKSLRGTPFQSGFIKGKKSLTKSKELQVPYKDGVLSGDALLSQVEKWVRYGTIEADCGEAIANVVRNSEWLDLSNHYFVLLGALSAMGPLRVLLSLGANIVAVDINRENVWKQLIELTYDSPGSITFPLSQPQDSIKSDAELYKAAGCDLLASTPEIADWLNGVFPGKPLVVGAYAYLDSDLFVRLSVAMDAIIAQLSSSRKDLTIAYLCTPTDCHLIPSTAYEAENDAFRKETLWMTMIRLLSRGQLLRKNATKPVQTENGKNLHYVDAIVVDQGPNYIMAKRIQHWRAIVAREVDKIRVSSNIAPSTATVSVVKNRSFAWAYNGMHNFKPMEVFKQETSNAVMTALLLNDINNPLSASNPSRKLENPLQLFAATSFHGGPWRTAHKFTTIGVPSALLYFLSILINYYLMIYNGVQAAGWSVVLFRTAQFAAAPTSSLWNSVGDVTSFFQFLALLEVFHAFVGITPAPAFHALLQITSRVVLVGVANTNPTAQNAQSLLVMLTAWSITEVVRYGYFFLKAIGFVNKPLTWLRYSLFIALYPIGVYGELATMLGSRELLTKTLAQTNLAVADNSTKYYAGCFQLIEYLTGLSPSVAALYIILPLYTIALPFLYLHMLSQRRKVLGGSKKGGKKEKKD